MNRTILNNQTLATSDNTVFVTVAAYPDHESVTAALRKTAEDHGVPIVFYDVGEPWQGFYHHKIEKMHEHMKHFRDAGKQFAFFFDSRDVVFIDPLDTILAKLNAIYDGRVIFSHDMPGKIWPSHNDHLLMAIEHAMQSEHARIAAGTCAGEIETIMKILQAAIEIRRELKEGRPRPGVLSHLYREIGERHCDDDQHLCQICMAYYPELFRLDYDKELLVLCQN